MQLPEQEEEDLNRIKEESRRRREAILEKYKKQNQQIEQKVRNDGKGIVFSTFLIGLSEADSISCSTFGHKLYFINLCIYLDVWQLSLYATCLSQFWYSNDDYILQILYQKCLSF